MPGSQPVIEKIIEELPEGGNAIVIVPSHRFKLFLASELSVYGKKIPYIFQLPELIDQLSEGALLADNPFVVQVALYKFLEDEGLWETKGDDLPLFRRFALIGQIIKDFEELLLNLPSEEDVLQIVKNIRDYYRTGTEFVDEEQRKHYLEILSDIWHVDQMTTVPPKQALEFISKLWELTGKFFLEDRGIYYYTKEIWGVPVVTEGVLLRKSLEEKQFAEKLIKRFNDIKVIVAGFGPLDTIYFEIFKHLKNVLKGNIVFIWEKGEWLEKLNNYILQPFLDMHSNIRNKYEKYSLIWQIKELSGIGVSYPLNEDIADVETHIVPNRTSQIGLLSNMIPQKEDEDSGKLRLILLLQKDLGSLLWHSFEKINLSMGLPIDLTPLKSFLTLLDELLYFIDRGGKTSFIPVSYYVRWQDHPIGKFLVSPEQGDDRQSTVDPSKTLFVSSSVWHQEVLNFLTSQGPEAISSFLNLLQYLDGQLSTDEKQNISRASVQQIAIVLHYLQPILKQLEDLDARQIVQFLRSMLFSQQVVLKGEPLHGLQAMEILETRGLSFEEVFIPDVSETTLPPPVRRLSMIPVSIRLFFGLPISEIVSFRYYYYLYRLLASTGGKIHFIVPSNMDGQPTQKSIVLNQIPVIFANKNVRTTVYVPSASLKPTDSDLSFVKSLIKLQRQDTPHPLTLYVTDLVTLLQCPRKFLLSKLIRKEIEEPYDLLGTDGRLIGNLVHNSLAKIYENDVDKSKLKSLIENEKELTALLKEVLLELIQTETSTQNIKDNFHLIPSFNLSKQYVKNILRRDYALLTNKAGETIKDIIHEQDINYEDSSGSFVIKGRIDRLEQWYADKGNTNTRIVDFKHGVSSNIKQKLTVPPYVLDHAEKIIEHIKEGNSTNGNDKAYELKNDSYYGIQIMIYKNLYVSQQNNASKNSILPYIYPISRVMSLPNDFGLKVEFSSRGHSESKYKSLSNEEKEQKLKELVIELSRSVSELLKNSATSIEDLIKRFFPIEANHCKGCKFKNICFVHKDD